MALSASAAEAWKTSWALTRADSWAIGSGWVSRVKEKRGFSLGWPKVQRAHGEVWLRKGATHVLKHALHDSNSNLSSLNEPVLPVLHVQPSLLHLGPLGGLEHLSRAVEFESGFGDGRSGSDGVLDRLLERLLERVQEALGNLMGGLRKRE